MRGATGLLVARGQNAPVAAQGEGAGSVTATIKYATSVGSGTWDSPETLIALEAATVTGPVFVKLNITGQTGTIAYVSWHTKLGAGAYVSRRAAGDDTTAPYNPYVNAAGIPISWWDNSQDGAFTLKATVVFTDASSQDVTAAFTVDGNEGGGLPPPTNLGWDIRNYMNQTGLHVLANGTYTAGTGSIAAPHAENLSAPYDGWLVLIAETKHGCIIDLSARALTTQFGTSRILFIGFVFKNGNWFIQGNNNIRTWYCNFTFPIDEWHDQYDAAGGVAYPPNTIPKTGGPPNRATEWAKLTAYNGNHSPQMLFMSPTASPNTNIEFYGADAYEIGDDWLHGWSVNDLKVVGLRAWKVRSKTPVADGGTNVEGDPGHALGSSQDWIHCDDIQTTGGWLRFLLEDSWLGTSKLMFSAEGKPLTDCELNRVWLAGIQQFGMQCGLSNNVNSKILGCTGDTIRSFCNGQGLSAGFNGPRYDYNLKTGATATWPSTLHIVGQFEMVWSNVTLTIPAGIDTTTVNGVPTLTDITQVRDHADNPANIWRAANPYDSWQTFFGWA